MKAIPIFILGLLLASCGAVPGQPDRTFNHNYLALATCAYSVLQKEDFSVQFVDIALQRTAKVSLTTGGGLGGTYQQWEITTKATGPNTSLATVSVLEGSIAKGMLLDKLNRVLDSCAGQRP